MHGHIGNELGTFNWPKHAAKRLLPRGHMELATGRSTSREVLAGALALVIVIISHALAKADEGGVSFHAVLSDPGESDIDMFQNFDADIAFAA
jgi:hypothetical protein